MGVELPDEIWVFAKPINKPDGNLGSARRWSCRPENWYDEKYVRAKTASNLPPERNPDVLMRALKDLHDLAIVHAGVDVVGPIDGRIQEAIRELESEAEDGN